MAADDVDDADTPEGDARQGIQSVENAMTVLLALEQGLGPMSLTQLAAASAMAPSKAHRYLVSLARVGLVSQSRSSGLYDMGPSMRRLGAESLRRMDEAGLASEYLPELRDRTGHAVNLAVWGDHGPIIVRWDYGSYALPITVRVGATLPLLSSSVGRIYLAHLPAALTDPVLLSQAETAEQTGLTDADIEQIKADARRDGFVVTAGGVLAGRVVGGRPGLRRRRLAAAGHRAGVPDPAGHPGDGGVPGRGGARDRRGGLGRARAGRSGAAADRAPGVAGGADAVSAVRVS